MIIVFVFVFVTLCYAVVTTKICCGVDYNRYNFATAKHELDNRFLEEQSGEIWGGYTPSRLVFLLGADKIVKVKTDTKIKIFFAVNYSSYMQENINYNVSFDDSFNCQIDKLVAGVLVSNGEPTFEKDVMYSYFNVNIPKGTKPCMIKYYLDVFDKSDRFVSSSFILKIEEKGIFG